MVACIRCGRADHIEKHHIIERRRGGGDEPENKENRCEPCHKYEHARRAILGALEYEKTRGQRDRIQCYEHRLAVLDGLNTPELIRDRGTYLSYWTDRSTRYLPRRIPTKSEAKLDQQLNLVLEEAMKPGVTLSPNAKEIRYGN